MHNFRIALLSVMALPALGLAQDSTEYPDQIDPKTGQAHCPLCVAGGYGIANGSGKWLLNTVYAPSTETVAETFLWYTVDNRLSVGLGHLWKQNAVRFLGTYQLAPEKGSLPSVHFMAGVQGIGEGNPGVSITGEKNFSVKDGSINVFAGMGYRTNREILRPVAGIKYTYKGNLVLGYQNDGLRDYPFATYTVDRVTFGAYLIEWKSPAILLGTRF